MQEPKGTAKSRSALLEAESRKAPASPPRVARKRVLSGSMPKAAAAIDATDANEAASPRTGGIVVQMMARQPKAVVVAR